MKNALVLQHAPYEGPGAIRPLLRRRGFCVQTCHVYREPALPTTFWDLIVLMGGPMNVDEEDRYPWLVAEKKFLTRCLDQRVPLLGICLGGQLLARVLGAPVTRNPEREIGWFDIVRDPAALAHPLGQHWPERCEVFHWHGDTFALPDGATLLASSQACAHQAFAYGNHVLALQFHPELTEASGEEMRCGCFEDLKTPGRFVQDQATLAADPARFAALGQQLHKLVTPWLDSLPQISPH
jgi:GMP synthase-like glutamine amidotransferase